MSSHDIADRNVERLLGTAYKPEPIDPAFVLETEEKLLAAARDERRTLQTSPADAAKLLRLRRRLSWAMSAAAMVAVCLLGYYAGLHQSNRLNIGVEPQAKGKLAEPGLQPLGLTAKPRPESAKPETIAVGEALATKHGERRRVALADGSILFVNENTTLTQSASRQVRLDQGEIYLEVAPRPSGERFTVQTAERQVVATGTHFHVAATAAGAGVLVTQGTVKVSDVARDVTAGQQVKPGDKQATVAQRASHVLDWLRPLVAAAEAPLVPGCSHEGGALIALDPNGQELQLTMRKYHIDVHIEDGFARTTIDQTYFNNTWSRLEGTFYFPLPPDASLSRLAMYVLDGKDCKLMEGGMAEREQAANAYETIRYERRDPALLEWVDGSTFKMRVFPLEAWQEKRIVLSYTQRLSPLYGVTRYRFPGGHNMQIVRDWSFAATVKNAKQMDVLTPSHPDMKRDSADELTLRTEARLIKPEQDVVLELREREAPPGGATFATHLQDGQRYFMARFRPQLDTKPQRQRRDWIVLFESSANRDPLLARTQIDVFRNLLRNVEYDDTLVVLTANTRTEHCFAKPQAAIPANVQSAVEFLERTHLVGGCDLEAALRKALEFAKDAKNPHLVHVGAGVASLGEPKDDVLAKLISDEVRYIGVGVGKKWNRAFMKMAAERTGGYFTQINPDEPVAWRAFDLLATLNTPRLLDVRVVDPDEKVVYLADAVTVAQGEEICAFTRGPTDKFELPKKVLVTGRLDGKPFRREVEVIDRIEVLSRDSGYLPRTWAKLEIDRLLADGQDKNKAAITALSKAMYVMSPFTSLLVLESEADYKRFNIDRGRKDHWAMYACPERIPQVYEPDPAYRQWWWHVEQPKEGQKPSEEQVLDTILLRLPPQHIFASGQQLHLPHVATARQLLMSGYAMPIVEEAETFLGTLRPGGAGSVQSLGLENERLSAGGLTIYSLGRNGFSSRFGFAERTVNLGDLDLRDLDFFERGRGGRSLARLSVVAGSPLTRNFRFEPLRTRLLRESDEDFGRPSTRFLSLQRQTRLADLIDERMPMAGQMPAQPRFAFQPFFRTLRGVDALMPMAKSRMKDAKSSKESWFFMDAEIPWTQAWTSSGLELTLTSLDGIAWPAQSKQAYAETWMLQLAEQLRLHQSTSWMVYQRPQHQVDDRLFGDLTIHAPGLNATWADIQNTVVLEAKQERPAIAGKIDAAARALFDKARQAGWHAVAYPGVGRIPGFKVHANGQGQFTYERTLTSGLVEQVVCDGQTLWHLYPEIGLGTRRPFSRFHFGELSRWIPWALPRIDDLAWDADLQAVDARTVAFVPHQQPAKTKDDKAATSRQLHFVFGSEGALAEARVVEMPSGKILARQAIDADGNIRWLDEAGKQLAEHKLQREAAAAPSVTPKLDELVILDMPLRTGPYWDQRVEQLRNEAKARKDESLPQPAYLGLFASSCFSRDRDTLGMFGTYFHAKGDKRLGFYTLLNVREHHFHQQPNTWAQGISTYDPVQEHPQSPLARYLVHHQKNLRVQHEADKAFLEDLPGPKDGFIARMAAFRNAWNAWRHYYPVGNDRKIYEREKLKLMEFVRINTSPLVAFILQSNMQHMDSRERADVSKLIYETQKDYVDPLGLGYVLGYDAAYHLRYKSDTKEASRLYRELYEQALKSGALPKIDDSFRSALDAAGSGPIFGEFMRGVVHNFLKKDQPHSALLVALQVSHSGGQSLGDELFQHIMQRLPKNADRLVLLAALEYVLHNRLDSRADALRSVLRSGRRQGRGHRQRRLRARGDAGVARTLDVRGAAGVQSRRDPCAH